MPEKKDIFVIIGSASNNSVKEKLIDYICEITNEFFNLAVFKNLKKLPHFDPELSTDNPPGEIIELLACRVMKN